jgi:hypothetical protein
MITIYHKWANYISSSGKSGQTLAGYLKIKPFNLGLSLKDNTQSQIPVAVSSLSSLSSKAPIVNPSLAVDSVCVK